MPLSFQEIYATVRRIPAGSVMSYGGIAALCGSPHAARAVGFAMRVCADPSVPCQRVVRRDGSLSEAYGTGGSAEQALLLQAEGVPFLADGRVDITRCIWRPHSC